MPSVERAKTICLPSGDHDGVVAVPVATWRRQVDHVDPLPPVPAREADRELVVRRRGRHPARIAAADPTDL
jgi:hypothetical protein